LPGPNLFLMSKPSHQSSARSGFTLIEILAVFALLGILAAVALSSQNRSSAPVAAEAAQLAAHLRYTQTRALADIVPWRLEFPNSTSYRISRVGDSPVRLPGTPQTTRVFPSGITLVAAPAEVRFDSWGRPVTSANTPIASDFSLTLTDGENQFAIPISAGTGLIR